MLPRLQWTVLTFSPPTKQKLHEQKNQATHGCVKHLAIRNKLQRIKGETSSEASIPSPLLENEFEPYGWPKKLLLLDVCANWGYPTLLYIEEGFEMSLFHMVNVLSFSEDNSQNLEPKIEQPQGCQVRCLKVESEISTFEKSLIMNLKGKITMILWISSKNMNLKVNMKKKPTY